MQIIIKQKAAEKMAAYVRNCELEISGLGKINVVNNIIYVEDVCIFKQQCTGSNTVLDINDMMAFLTELVSKGESPKDYKLWWHSHVNMPVFWSATDVNTMESSTEFDMLVSIVTNKKGDYKARIDLNQPIKIHKDNIPISREYSYEQDEEIIAEIKEKITKITYQTNLSPVYNTGFGAQQRLTLPYSQTIDEDFDYIPTTKVTNVKYLNDEEIVKNVATQHQIDQFWEQKTGIEEEIDTAWQNKTYDEAEDYENVLTEFLKDSENKGIPIEYFYSCYVDVKNPYYKTQEEINQLFA